MDLIRPMSMRGAEALTADTQPGGELGAEVEAWLPADDWSDKTSWAFLRRRAASIGGGTVEMMRNILGERVLGMPKEPDLYAGRSWRGTPR
jgi:alkylation response protein AidB-like acyl-CoA dehydrogenase